MNIGAAKRLKYGLKRLFTFRQGRVDARRYIRLQQRILDRANRGLERKIGTALNRATQQFLKTYQDGLPVQPNVISRQLNEEMTAAISSQVRKIVDMVYDNNNQRYEAIQSKGEASFGEAFGGLDPDRRQDVGLFLFGRADTYQRISERHVTTLQGILGSRLSEGGSVAAISKDIQEKMRPISRNRAALIARTESHSALSYSQHRYHQQAASSYGIIMKKQWVATSDQRTRSAHAQMNGTEVPMDDAFQMPNGAKMQYPGDPDGGASNVINCRCVVLYVESEDEVVDSAKPNLENDQGIEIRPDGRPKGLDNYGMAKRYALADGGQRRAALNAAKDRMRSTISSNKDGWGDLGTERRFRGRDVSDYGVLDENLFNAPGILSAALAMDEIVQELNVLADLFKVPRLRGIKRIPEGRALANMGDGVMGINGAYLKRVADGGFDKKQKATSTWKLGDDPDARPFTAESFDDNWVDDLRSTMYHEFGHTIHQVYGVGKRSEYYDPPIEKWLTGKRLKKTAATRYADTNGKEWFAENFALWASGKDELVSPRFLKLIQVIKSGEMPDGKT